MPRTRATVTCQACDLEETFTKLGDARAKIEAHRAATGHEAVWELARLSEGVERAGDQAGVCGVPGTTDTDSPLYWDGSVPEER